MMWYIDSYSWCSRYRQCFCSQRVKKKSWFVCLSTNQRAFHYGDCDDKDRLMLDCSSKILVCNIRMLVTGKKCPHVRDVRWAPVVQFLCWIVPEYFSDLYLYVREREWVLCEWVQVCACAYVCVCVCVCVLQCGNHTWIQHSILRYSDLQNTVFLQLHNCDRVYRVVCCISESCYKQV